MSKSIEQAKREAQKADAAYSSVRTALLGAVKHRDRMLDKIAEWQRVQSTDRMPTVPDPDRRDGRTSRGAKPDLPGFPPATEDYIEELKAEERNRLEAKEQAGKTLADVRAAKKSNAGNTGSPTGWLAARGFKFDGEFYDLGDPIEPAEIPVAKWQKLVNARYVRPSGHGVLVES